MNTEMMKRMKLQTDALPAIVKIISDTQEMLSALCGTKVTLAMSMNTFEITLTAIQTKVCDMYGVSWAQIAGAGRRTDIVDARFAYCWLCKNFLKMTLKRIAETINRDHTSVIHALNEVQRRMEVGDDAAIKLMLQIANFLTNNGKGPETD